MEQLKIGIKEKSFDFAMEVVSVCRFLAKNQHEFVLSKQLLRSGTAIGALVREAEHGQSKPDFLSKMNIALKEANETVYWIELLFRTKLLLPDDYKKLNQNGLELVKILASIVKTTKFNLGR